MSDKFKCYKSNNGYYCIQVNNIIFNDITKEELWDLLQSIGKVFNSEI